MPQAINIAVSHSLTQEAAFDRVLAWLSSQRGTNPHVTPLQTQIDNLAHTITLTVNAYGYTVKAVVSVSPSQVQVVTNDATDLAERAGMWWESLQLKKQLAEVLK